ncbi:DUF4159 domain-containing protein [Anaerobaca lacustris]|uniref:DUF4159 domain-containing protein n=1 Tax=Anaerobaca lacustris TaxID=3044600 RepID=A0AAW6U235_9BACT|nr:DUF4159 domain-containing protein [Sedimentisphaerales bacterium M17dextr]
MTRTRWVLALLVVSAVGGTLVFAQRYYDRGGVPDWQTDKEFAHDVFTFVRIQYSSGYGGGGFGPGRGRRGFGRGGGRWATDYPDSDLNFSYRLQQLTSLEVNPDGLILELTDPELFNYPFIYIVEPGYLVFTEEEVVALRRYLLNGGFLMVDDFWGQEEWYNFYYEIKRVFPDREPVELPLSHPIFRAVFELKEKPQIPSVDAAIRGRPYGITWEREDAREPHYRALYDDKGRMMAIICHNTDLGDGWEEEGTDEWFFREFSEKKAYPMGINIVFYAMTR